MTPEQPFRPWYREPWPWIVMAGPVAVVVAGIATTIIAVRTSDGVVADDYYKQGLAINRTIERDVRAQSLGIAAQVLFNEEREAVRVILASNAPLPPSLRIALIHPTRQGEDQTVVLRHVGPALYEGRLNAPHGSAWRLALEDGEGSWRVSGRWLVAEKTVTLGTID